MQKFLLRSVNMLYDFKTQALPSNVTLPIPTMFSVIFSETEEEAPHLPHQGKVYIQSKDTDSLKQNTVANGTLAKPYTLCVHCLSYNEKSANHTQTQLPNQTRTHHAVIFCMELRTNTTCKHLNTTIFKAPFQRTITNLFVSTHSEDKI